MGKRGTSPSLLFSERSADGTKQTLSRVALQGRAEVGSETPASLAQPPGRGLCKGPVEGRRVSGGARPSGRAAAGRDGGGEVQADTG